MTRTASGKGNEMHSARFGDTHGTLWSACRRGLGGVLLAGLVAVAPLQDATAQTDDPGAATGSYITPFPGADAYRLVVIGDNFGDGVHQALQEGLGREARVAVDRSHLWLAGLTRPDFTEELREAMRGAAAAKPHIAVVITGAQDRWSYRAPDGRRFQVGSQEWRNVYAGHVDQVVKALKAEGAAVYWIGLPIMRRADANEAAVAINEVVRERCYLNGVKYIDVYQGFATEEGWYSPYGPDIAGKQRLLRTGDGIHMSEAGYVKLAHFVERELKRDLAQAKNERAIPLAGTEAEQALINPGARRGLSAAGAAGRDGSAAADASGVDVSSSPSGDQKAETSRVTLDVPGNESASVTVDIVRPAIPAAVILAVTKQESADKLSQMGDPVIEQLSGGLTVMSTVTPGREAGADSARRKVSAAQTPYFRVLIKGERLVARAGRADDLTWPRPQPEPLPQRADPQADEGGESPIPLPVPRPYR